MDDGLLTIDHNGLLTINHIFLILPHVITSYLNQPFPHFTKE